MSTVIASHVPSSISTDKLQKFFSFCGDIKSINLLEKIEKFLTYEVNFESPKAIDTALLLNEAELEGVQIKIEAGSGSSSSTKSEDAEKPPSYSAVPSKVAPLEKGEPPSGDNKIQTDVTKTGDSHYDDINQVEKPKYAIMAQLLASGYTLSDNIILRAIEVDNQKGYTSKFKSFLSDLDLKYIQSSNPESDFNKNVAVAQSKLADLQSQLYKSKYTSKFSHYFDKAASHPYGVKVHDFYKGVAQNVQDVHTEAKRLNALQKEQQAAAAASTPTSAADATSAAAAAEDAPVLPPRKE